MKTETANTTTKTETESGNVFTMPCDVATRLLCNPKNKMTAKMRKRAKFARTKFIEAKSPVLTYPGGGFVRKAARLAKIKKQPRYAADRSKTGGEKFAGKLKGKKFKQLLTWERRIAARIHVLDKLAVRLDELKETRSAEHISARIQSLHAIGSLLQQELDSRG